MHRLFFDNQNHSKTAGVSVLGKVEWVEWTGRAVGSDEMKGNEMR